MFQLHNRVYSKILLSADAAACLVALILAYFLRSLIRFAPQELRYYFSPELLPLLDYVFYFLVFLPFWLILLVASQRYSSVLHRPWREQASRVGQFAILTGFLMGFLAYTFKLEISRPLLFLMMLMVGVLLVCNRTLLAWILRSRNINDHNKINILIVGTSDRALALGKRLDGFKKWGFHVVGYLAGNGGIPASDPQVLGSLRELPELLKEQVVADEIFFVGSDLRDLATYEEMIRYCENLGIRTRLVADFMPHSISRISMDFLDDLPLITFSTVPDHSLVLIVKRVIDFSVAVGCLLLLSPLVLVTALLVKLTSPGPVFYRQTRCGLFGRRFTLVKFRTMVDGAQDRLWEIRHLNEMDGPVFKMRNDPRVTALGGFLRRSSIDEIPQFWNVVKGEMSIVGPRAPLPEEVGHYSLRQRRRLSVKPGITCLWQVSGRSHIDFQRWMDLDLEYIDNWSLWLDLGIMLKTIPAVFTGRGAR